MNSLSLSNSIHSRITADDRAQQLDRLRARDPTFQQIEQDRVVDAVKEFPDITLQRPARSGPITTDTAGKGFQTIHGRMRAFTDAAGVGIEDERRLEERSESAIDRMMDDPVSHGRFVNDAMFWIKDVKPLVRAVTIYAARYLFMELKEIDLNMPREKLNVRFMPLSSTELAPSRKEVL